MYDMTWWEDCAREIKFYGTSYIYIYVSLSLPCIFSRFQVVTTVYLCIQVYSASCQLYSSILFMEHLLEAEYWSCFTLLFHIFLWQNLDNNMLVCFFLWLVGWLVDFYGRIWMNMFLSFFLSFFDWLVCLVGLQLFVYITWVSLLYKTAAHSHCLYLCLSIKSGHFFFFLHFVVPNGIVCHGKFRSLSPKKASCNSVALPNPN